MAEINAANWSSLIFVRIFGTFAPLDVVVADDVLVLVVVVAVVGGGAVGGGGAVVVEPAVDGRGRERDTKTSVAPAVRFLGLRDFLFDGDDGICFLLPTPPFPPPFPPPTLPPFSAPGCSGSGR